MLPHPHHCPGVLHAIRISIIRLPKPSLTHAQMSGANEERWLSGLLELLANKALLKGDTGLTNYNSTVEVALQKDFLSKLDLDTESSTGDSD